MQLYVPITKTVLSSKGILIEIHHGGTKTLWREERNLAKKSGNWTDYKRTLTALRQAKRESWRRHCEEIEKTPECARLHRILSKDIPSAISSIQLENGDYITKEIGILEGLIRVHFPGAVTI
jgi:hypothetical protein